MTAAAMLLVGLIIGVGGSADAVVLRERPPEAADAVSAVLELDGVSYPLSEVGTISSSYRIEEVETVAPGGDVILRPIPGPLAFEPIPVVVPGASEALIDWFAGVRAAPDGNRRDGSIVFFDDNQEETLRVNLIGVWPTRAALRTESSGSIFTEIDLVGPFEVG